MPSYDLIMLLIVVATTAWGLWKGFAWQLASLTSVFSSYGVAYSLRAPVAKMIDADPPWNMFAAMLIVYILMSLVSWIGFGLLATSISSLQLKDFDRQLGGMMGAAKGALLCVVVTFFAVTLTSPQQQEAICKSTSGYYIAVALKNSGGLIPPEMSAVVSPYLKTLEEKLAGHHPDLPALPAAVEGYVAAAADQFAHAYQAGYQQPPEYQQPQYAAPQYSSPQYPAAQYPAPQYSTPQYANQQYNSGYYDARQQGSQYAPPSGYYDSRYADPRYAPPAPAYADPRYAAPQYADPRYQNYPTPQAYDPRYQYPPAAPAGYGYQPNPGQVAPADNSQWR
ncbi:MAG TPA: CvpA family protein [Pirellulaceae bacterium]|nr:CvpA family protein [Pirellulaceae bacterium]